MVISIIILLSPLIFTAALAENCRALLFIIYRNLNRFVRKIVITEVNSPLVIYEEILYYPSSLLDLLYLSTLF